MRLMLSSGRPQQKTLAGTSSAHDDASSRSSTLELTMCSQYVCCLCAPGHASWEYVRPCHRALASLHPQFLNRIDNGGDFRTGASSLTLIHSLLSKVLTFTSLITFSTSFRLSGLYICARRHPFVLIHNSDRKHASPQLHLRGIHPAHYGLTSSYNRHGSYDYDFVINFNRHSLRWQLCIRSYAMVRLLN